MKKRIAVIASTAAISALLLGCDNARDAEGVAQTDTDPFDERYDGRHTDPREPVNDTYGTTGTAPSYDPSLDRSVGTGTDDGLDAAASDSETASSTDSDLATGTLASMSADELQDSQVVTAEGEVIGEIVAVRDDSALGEQVVVVEVGSFLGVGEKTVALPFSSLQMTAAGQVKTSMTRDALESAPAADEQSAETESQ